MAEGARKLLPAPVEEPEKAVMLGAGVIDKKEEVIGVSGSMKLACWASELVVVVDDGGTTTDGGDR